jgi:hypothetical protein
MIGASHLKLYRRAHYQLSYIILLSQNIFHENFSEVHQSNGRFKIFQLLQKEIQNRETLLIGLSPGKISGPNIINIYRRKFIANKYVYICGLSRNS